MENRRRCEVENSPLKWRLRKVVGKKAGRNDSVGVGRPWWVENRMAREVSRRWMAGNEQRGRESYGRAAERALSEGFAVTDMIALWEVPGVRFGREVEGAWVRELMRRRNTERRKRLGRKGLRGLWN